MSHGMTFCDSTLFSSNHHFRYWHETVVAQADLSPLSRVDRKLDFGAVR